MRVPIRLGLALITAAATVALGAEASRPEHDIADGNQLELIYFGGSHCGPCKSPRMREAVLKAKAIFAERAAAQHRPYSTTGVALDLSPEAGIEYLKEVGPFDQVISGRSWFNQAVLDWIVPYPDAIAGIPQIVIVERRMTLDKEGKARFERPKVLARIPGTGIPLWVDAGAQTD